MGVDFQTLARVELPCRATQDFLSWSDNYYQDTKIKIPTIDEITYICLLHVSVHRFIQPPGIRLYFDLLVLSRCKINYAKIIEWCDSYNTRTCISAAADISNRLLSTKFPVEITHLSDTSKITRRSIHNKYSNLIEHASRIKVLLIEVLCDDAGILHGVMNILFPSKDWLRLVYNKNVVVAELKHLNNLLF